MSIATRALAAIGPRIETARLWLTLPQPCDAERLLAYNERNRAHLAPFSPPEPAGSRDSRFWVEYVARVHNEFEAGASVRLRLAARDDPHGPFLGAVSLSELCRGPFRACYLGYHLDHAAVGRGLMQEALQAVIGHAFEDLRLHRIMANYLPDNFRSGRLLSRLGFVIEGYAREYLLINGAWRDHVLTSLTNRSLSADDVTL